MWGGGGGRTAINAPRGCGAALCVCCLAMRILAAQHLGGTRHRWDAPVQGDSRQEGGRVGGTDPGPLPEEVEGPDNKEPQKPPRRPEFRSEPPGWPRPLSLSLLSLPRKERTGYLSPACLGAGHSQELRRQAGLATSLQQEPRRRGPGSQTRVLDLYFNFTKD